jgi:hypothetical protein
MKRIVWATFLSLSLTLTAGIPTRGQASRTSTPPTGLVKVTSRTVSALRAGTSYTADLSRRGVVYEFSPADGPIDFSKILVRSAAGQQPIGTYLSRTFGSGLRVGWRTSAFRLGAAADLRKLPPSVRPASRTTNIIQCPPGSGYCTCDTKDECDILLWFLDCIVTICGADYSICGCAYEWPRK